MPLYEYSCDSCTMVFEELVFSQSFSVKCPNCGGSGAKRMLSTFSPARGGSAPDAACGEGACATPGAGRANGGGCCGGTCGCGH
jgi:putative FmdB family regulatory protein